MGQLNMLLKKIEENRAKINAYRPLSKEEVKELDNYYRVGLTYSSNALEGNTLTISETKVLLEDGLTAGGKPIRDCYEATGHAAAYDYMLQTARGGELNFSEELICHLHQIFYQAIDSGQAGVYRDHQVFISGTEYVPPASADVPAKMKELVDDLNRQRTETEPVLLAAYAHRRLVDIHPFAVGNGRTARLLMNLVLINEGYCLVSIPPILRHSYIAALRQAQRAECSTDVPFNELIAECELEAQRDYFRMFHIS